MNSIQITPVGMGDINLLQHIGRLTFSESFSSANNPEDMTNYLEESFSIEKLRAELSDQNSYFYFATLAGKVIAYLKLNIGASQTELKDDKALEIERIYVLKEYQGKKVGQLLYHQAILVAEQKQADYIWLGVWEENLSAISFYKKNGFVAFDKHIFRLGNDEQKDVMMKKVLSGDRLLA
ncbi:ribosomal protein S18 acetylase RimI-like enzyme [Pedobacter sp. CAN_A7]|uniref:GNAT family N-acetyltransferase n=1 Tax=Pedobacter sp. CAN_A7 TaxID=2787722 RepID=UPI0018C9CF73